MVHQAPEILHRLQLIWVDGPHPQAICGRARSCGWPPQTARSQGRVQGLHQAGMQCPCYHQRAAAPLPWPFSLEAFCRTATGPWHCRTRYGQKKRISYAGRFTFSPLLRLALVRISLLRWHLQLYQMREVFVLDLSHLRMWHATPVRHIGA